MYEYLNDIDFLTALDKVRLRTTYARLTLLTFDEKPVREIQGDITTGSLNVSGASAVRRTISLTMLADARNADLQNVENEISIKRKVKIYIGLQNPLKEYQKYGDIVWFPCGLFILSDASIQRSTSSWTISIKGKDKMCLLDGTAGGTLPATVEFHKRNVEVNDSLMIVEEPTISQIIYEAVNHWGGEISTNIVISDLDEQIKLRMKYLGTRPIYFSDTETSMSFEERVGFQKKVGYGEDAGYTLTDFTYPGELILKAGDTVVTLLDKIVKTLGNYEYFYDLNGRFIFQQIKNYLNTPSSLFELEEKYYVKSYNNRKFLYSLTDLDTTTSITVNPSFDNIKNDFYVWGKRKTVSGVDRAIRYHLAIDSKPSLDWANHYMWEVSDGDSSESYDNILRYEPNDDPNYKVSGYTTKLIGPPCGEWREELYRQALNARVTTGTYNTYYDAELLEEWRKLYDPNKEEWQETNYWNPAAINAPGTLDFWLDFIDTGSVVGKYSVSEIGRRTKVVNNDSVKAIYNKEPPDIVFVEGDINDPSLPQGYQYFQLTPYNYSMFGVSTTGSSCFDEIRDMLYQSLNYNTKIQITCLPKYYIEPNNIIYIEDKESGIAGNYQITQYTLPLTYDGTMSITAAEVLTRI